MSVVIENCANCKGEGKYPNPDFGTSRECFGCNGFGKRGKGGYSAYKSQAMADRYGKTCNICEGSGIWHAPEVVDCYECNLYARGRVVTSASAGDILPEEIGRCDSIGGSVLNQIIDGIEFVVMRAGRGLNWGESYLGLGAITTCTDYGRAWEMTDDQIKEKVVSSLREDRIQWLNIMDSERKIVERVAIQVMPNGYRVLSIGSLNTSPVLPPTYTDSVLNRPA